ncbi:hypothetical protein ZOSMA_452G00080 [Zostera marina]|uniref:Uncharacterized protein n=1 Tax=Zostera marina TaxID=29655 RepID=A0A0K9P0R1_ZOSMR|nr:hypothetical protein ZOSMA_452G00080 [Zostera marina]
MNQDSKVQIFCPKPRRIADDLRGFVGDDDREEDSEFPSFFCGSPPRRATNPLIHDVRFLETKQIPFLSSNPTTSSPPPPPTELFRTTTNFVPDPVPPVRRIEGFDCLNRGNRVVVGCSISAFA